MTSSIVDLLAAISTHLDTFEVPSPWSVHVARDQARGVDIQLGCEGRERLAAALLAWADTLTEVSAQAWRCYDGDRVHLSTSGRLATGVRVHVYGSIAYSARGIGATLAPGANTSLPPGVLSALATPGDVSA